jgi:hypothetical protein
MKRGLVLLLLVVSVPMYGSSRHTQHAQTHHLSPEVRAAQQRAKASRKAQKQLLKDARKNRQTIR